MADKAGTGQRSDQIDARPTEPTQQEVAKPGAGPPGATEVKPADGAGGQSAVAGAAAPDATPKVGQATVAETPAQLQSRLDGLRGWLAALDRRVSIRTQVGIVLLALAIGFGAAALYVAIDARDNGASEARVESLREALQALNLRTARTARQVRELQAGGSTQATGGGSSLQNLQDQVTQLNVQVQALQAASGSGSGSSSGGAGGGSSGGASGRPAGTTTAPSSGAGSPSGGQGAAPSK